MFSSIRLHHSPWPTWSHKIFQHFCVTNLKSTLCKLQAQSRTDAKLYQASYVSCLHPGIEVKQIMTDLDWWQPTEASTINVSHSSEEYWNSSSACLLWFANLKQNLAWWPCDMKHFHITGPLCRESIGIQWQRKLAGNPLLTIYLFTGGSLT